MQSFLTDLRLIILHIFVGEYWFEGQRRIGVDFFVILKHLLNIPNKQIGKRCRTIIIIALPTTTPSILLGNLLHLDFQFFKMTSLLRRRPGGSKIIAVLAKIDTFKLIGIVIHDNEIL
jgi:hypothetical protein